MCANLFVVSDLSSRIPLYCFLSRANKSVSAIWQAVKSHSLHSSAFDRDDANTPVAGDLQNMQSIIKVLNKSDGVMHCLHTAVENDGKEGDIAYLLIIFLIRIYFVKIEYVGLNNALQHDLANRSRLLVRMHIKANKEVFIINNSR